MSSYFGTPASGQTKKPQTTQPVPAAPGGTPMPQVPGASAPPPAPTQAPAPKLPPPTKMLAAAPPVTTPVQPPATTTPAPAPVQQTTTGTQTPAIAQWQAMGSLLKGGGQTTQPVGPVSDAPTTPAPVATKPTAPPITQSATAPVGGTPQAATTNAGSSDNGIPWTGTFAEGGIYAGWKYNGPNAGYGKAWTGPNGESSPMPPQAVMDWVDAHKDAPVEPITTPVVDVGPLDPNQVVGDPGIGPIDFTAPPTTPGYGYGTGPGTGTPGQPIGTPIGSGGSIGLNPGDPITPFPVVGDIPPGTPLPGGGTSGGTGGLIPPPPGNPPPPGTPPDSHLWDLYNQQKKAADEQWGKIEQESAQGLAAQLRDAELTQSLNARRANEMNAMSGQGAYGGAAQAGQAQAQLGGLQLRNNAIVDQNKRMVSARQTYLQGLMDSAAQAERLATTADEAQKARDLQLRLQKATDQIELAKQMIDTGQITDPKKIEEILSNLDLNP